MKIKRIILSSLLSISLAAGVGAAFVLSKNNKQQAEAYTAPKKVGLTNAVIDTSDASESEIQDYYASLNDLSTSERKGTNLLKHLKPILQDGSQYTSYSNTRKWLMITDRDWIQSPLDDPTVEYTYPTDTSTAPKTHVLYRTDNGETTAINFHGVHSGDGALLNKEHTWPKACGFKTNYESSAPGTDLHHLILADDGINSTSHSNYPYGDSSTSTINTSSKITDTSNTYGIGYRWTDTSGNTYFEPQDQDKGDIARALLYMVARYNNYEGSSSLDTSVETNLELINMDASNYSKETVEATASSAAEYGDLETLLRWNELDPVSDFEIHRNNLIYNNYQKNRNPFIDYPEWIDYIWGDQTGYAQPDSDTISQYGKTCMTITGTASVQEGNTSELDVEITGVTGSSTILWESSDTSVATVDSSGVVTGVSAGTATISAITKDSTFYAEKEVTITENVPVTGVTLDNSEMNLTVGDNGSLTATVSPSNAYNQNITWSSSNTDVANVSNGTVTAISAGSATITVTTEDGGYTATCEVTVTASTVSVTGVTLDNSELALTVGDSSKLTATITPNDATDTSVAWSSSDTSIATVTNKGVVSAVAAGSATITVTTTDGGYKDTCTVTVSESVTPSEGTYALTFTNNASDSSSAVSTDTFIDKTVTTNTLVSAITDTSKCYAGTSGLKLGTSSVVGTFTATVNSTVAALKIKSIQIASAQYGSDTGKLALTIDGTAVTSDITPGEDYTYTLTTPATISSFGIATTAKRAYLSSVTFVSSSAETEEVDVTGVSLNTNSATLTIGSTLTLTSTISPSNATDKTVTWTSSDETVATVDGGVVTALAVGNATITVTTTDGGYNATCTVTVDRNYTSIETIVEICSELDNKATTDQEYLVKGTVTGIYSNSFFIQQGTYGVYVYNHTIEGNAVGKVVYIKSTFYNYNGQFEANAVSESAILEEEGEQINPVIVNSLSDLNDSMLNSVVSFVGLTYSSGTYDTSSNSNIVFTLSNGTETVTYRTNKNLDDTVKEAISSKITAAQKKGATVNLVGVHYVTFSGANQLNIYSADQIIVIPAGKTDKQLVQNFIDDYMHMDDYDPTLSGEGSNLCLGADGYYMKAKKALTVMTEDQITIFRTDSDFTNAKDRYEAWASAYGDTTPYDTKVTPSNTLRSVTPNNNAGIYIALVIASLTITASLFFLIKFKKKEQ